MESQSPTQSQGEIMSNSSLFRIKAFSQIEVSSLLQIYQKYQCLVSDLTIKQFELDDIKSAALVRHNKLSVFKRSLNVSYTEHEKTNLKVLRDKIARLTAEVTQVSSDMKFQNPLIWVMYKFQAYQGTPKAVTTVNDLLTHDDAQRKQQGIPTICDRRLSYINRWLQAHHDSDIQMFGLGMKLSSLCDDTHFTDMLLDDAFMSGWSYHENNEKGKWYGYQM